MNIRFKLILLLFVVYASQFVYLSSTPAELVEPTRNLEGQETEAMGRLTVLSEPPGLKVSLDGKGLGNTPAFMVEVKPGIHALKVKDSETEFYIEPGKTIKISFFKNEFIEIPEAPKAPADQPGRDQQKKASAPPPVQPSPASTRAKEELRRAEERWMRFVDGSSPHF